MHVAKAVYLILLAVVHVVAHGLVTRIIGANGVTMPGLTVADGTPRDCPSAACGGQKDTAVIRDQEMGTIKASALGRTLISGPVNPEIVINKFMAPATERRYHARHLLQGRQLVNDAASVITNAGGAVLNGAQDLADKTPFGGAVKDAQSAVDDVAGALPGTKAGSVTASGTKENGLSVYSGKGSVNGLPTASADGVITMIYHQVNQDGAGPLSADIDASSGGTDAKAFQPAEVIQNVPGIAGFSTSSTMDYEIKVRIPPGTKCTGAVGTAEQVCIVRVRNNAISGPFGGSAAFTI